MKKYTVEVHDNGDRFWKNERGQFHREDGPAVEYSNWKKWYKNDKLHRTDGPAVEWSTGYKAWFINGQLHREDGPAVEYPNGSKEWWMNGNKYSKEEFNLQINSCHSKVVEIDGKTYQLKEI